MANTPESGGLADSAWPCRGHDARHTGQSPYLGAQANTLKWNYQTGAWVYSSPAVGADGTVYVGSGWGDGQVYALNPEDGTLKWSFQTGGIVISSPAIGNDGTIYIGSNDNYIYALNPDGSLKWSFQTGGVVVSSPAIGDDGTVYVGSGWAGAKIHAFFTKVAVPQFSPSYAKFINTITVTITCPTPEATIRYTTDGSEPTEESKTYNAPIILTSTTTIKAKGFKSNWTPSDTVTKTYTQQKAGLGHYGGYLISSGGYGSYGIYGSLAEYYGSGGLLFPYWGGGDVFGYFGYPLFGSFSSYFPDYNIYYNYGNLVDYYGSSLVFPSFGGFDGFDYFGFLQYPIFGLYYYKGTLL